MRFNCGATPEQKAKRIALEQKEAKQRKERYLSNWHDKFAWLPVKLDFETDGETDKKKPECVWLENVRRRGIYSQGEWAWVYKLADKWGW